MKRRRFFYRSYARVKARIQISDLLCKTTDAGR
jgi:hypothetical protein